MKKNLMDKLDGLRPTMERAALDIWKHPELGFKERYAVDLYEGLFSSAGFEVVKGVGEMETALVATWGDGGPNIGFLGEYDALPGVTKDGEVGHGCGHNLLGAAAAGSALALAELLKERGLPGRVTFYGCPAEENGGGKVYMAREGCFFDLDAAITWHPWDFNALWAASSLALNACDVTFHGKSAHAAASPQEGRSALDGAILMDVGVNYLREHMIQEARIHSVISSGGDTPNVVPAKATICYYVRTPRRDQIEPLFQRVVNCAKGAALMTDTSVEVKITNALYDYLPNETLGEVARDVMAEIEGPEFDGEDLALAKEIQSTLPEGAVKAALRGYRTTAEYLGENLSSVIMDDNGPLGAGKTISGSTDVGDVSYITPTVQMAIASMPIGVPGHTWQSTQAFGSPMGLKGMFFASKAMALTGLRLIEGVEILSKAKKELETARGGPYISPLPPEARPKLG